MTQSVANASAGVGITDAVEQLKDFTGSPGEFLTLLLRLQCQLASAEIGAVARATDDQRMETLAMWPPPPPNSRPPTWLTQNASAITQVAHTAEPAVQPLRGSSDLYGQAAEAHLLILPCQLGPEVRGAAVFFIRTRSREALTERRERLALSMSLVSVYETRQVLEQRTRALTQMQQAGRVLAAVNEHERATAALMAMCNELAAITRAERVGIGFLHGRYVKLAAVSHTEHFTRKMELVQWIESAMEEALDQDLEVIHPALPEAPYVSRAAEQLSSRHGAEAVCSLPLRRNGRPVGVITVERAADLPFETADVELLRLVCELITARAVELHERDRWFGARLAQATRKGLGQALGPEHTWFKAAAIAVLAAILFFSFAKGSDYIDAPFVIEASERRIIPAPFDGFLDKSHVQPNDQVLAGQTLLATLDPNEIELQLAPLLYERVEHQKEAAKAMRDGKSVEAQIAQAQADRLAARIDLLQHRLEQTRITCPIDGVVLRGDLRQKEGSPVSKGDVLFEVAPLENLRAALMVPEHRISDLRKDQTGELATAASPGVYTPFVVERINPMAEVHEEKNVFRVRVRFTEPPENLLPGVEGAAKIKVGRAHYAWLWTRDLVHWVRMRLWI